MKDYQVDTTTQDVTLVGICFFSASNVKNVTNAGLESTIPAVHIETAKPKYPFPNPKQSNISQNGYSFCTSQRVIEIYKKATGKNQKRLTELVEQWFIQTAKQNNWEEAIFINDCSAKGKKAGCMLRVKPEAGLPYAATH